MFAASKSGSVDAKDPQFNYVTMLLHGNGTNGAQNNTFVDSSTNNFTITRNGNTTQGTFTPYGSNWSNYFGGSPYLETPSNVAFSWGTGDFSIEFYVFPTSTSTLNRCVHFSDDISNLAIDASNRVELWIGSAFNSGSYTVSPNIWTHICATRVSGTCRLFINGMLVASTSSSFNKGTGSAQVGGSGTYANDLSGYLSNVRLLKGAIPAGYSTSSTTAGTQVFIPSTTPLTAESGTSLLTCQSNRFVDNSSNAFALTVNGSPSVQRFSPFSPTTAYSTSVIGGSGYFDGSGGYLTAPNNSAFNLGSNSFTIEAFFYTSSTSDQVLISAWNTNSFEIIYYAGTLYCQANALTPRLTTTTWPLNQWNHIAFVRSGNTYSAYLNGTRFATTTDIQSIANINAGPTIGVRQGGSSFPFSGYISNLRVVNGTAVYDPTSSTLTVPTAPLTAITNTSLLLSYTNAGILDNAMMNDLETVGNAQISTSVKKYGTGSMYFDGAGDYLTAPSNPAYNLGSGSFTVEFWLYPNTITIPNPDNESWLVARTNYSADIGWSVFQANQQIRFRIGNTGGTIATGNVITATTWQHIAVVRSGSTISIYVNGTSQGSGTNSSFTDASTVLVVGGITSTTGWNGDKPLNGYIDDLRITKGVARYTANFSVPTAAFPNN